MDHPPPTALAPHMTAAAHYWQQAAKPEALDMTDADLLARYVDVFNEPGMTVHAIYRHLDGSFFVRNIFADDPPTTTAVTEKQVRGVLIHESIGSLRRHLTAAGEEFLKDVAS